MDDGLRRARSLGGRPSSVARSRAPVKRPVAEPGRGGEPLVCVGRIAVAARAMNRPHATLIESPLAVSAPRQFCALVRDCLTIHPGLLRRAPAGAAMKLLSVQIRVEGLEPPAPEALDSSDGYRETQFGKFNPGRRRWLGWNLDRSLADRATTNPRKKSSGHLTNALPPPV